MKKRETSWLLALVLLYIMSSLLVSWMRRTEVFAAHVELPVYDALTVTGWPWNEQTHPDIVLVTMSDEGFWRGLDDEVLASLISDIMAGGPSVIAVDLIRDNALPPGSEKLESVVCGANPHGTNVIMASGIPGLPGKEGFLPPPFLRDPDRSDSHVGLAVIPEDRPGRPMIRRGLVAIDGGSYLSMSAKAAVMHLSGEREAELEAVYQRLAEISSLSPDAGGYVGSEEQGNLFLLKCGPKMDQLFPVLAAENVGEMTAGEIRSAFAGKVVFIGTEPILGQDEKPVLGNPDLRGVKLIACATAQLLRELAGEEQPIRWVSDTRETLAVWAAGLLCMVGFAGIKGPLWIRISCMVPLLCGGWWLFGAWMLGKGSWFPVGAPMVATVLSGVGTHALMHLRARGERESIYALLEQHLSPEVAGAVWEHNQTLLEGNGPPPECFVGTALFADLRGYSGITEHFQKHGRNEPFIAWLNRYLKAVIPLIRTEQGFVQQFAGDGIFVIFGFPANRAGGHANQAVTCAKAMAGAVEALNRSLEPDMPPYHARIGIYTGEMISGTVGDQSHASYSFFGSTINKAARLESLKKELHSVDQEPVRILISEPTRLAMDDSSACEEFLDGPVELDRNLPPERVWKIRTISQDP